MIIQDFRGGRCLLVATDLAARGLDLPEVSHVYNMDMPPNVNSYVHRAGRTGRRPIEEERGTVTNFIIQKELFVLERIENECNSKFLPLQI
jgi:superfamily II DNA/RNA helicase